VTASERPAPATGTGLFEVAAQTLFDIESTAITDDSAGEQLRRRRAASLRCEPMSDGRRDPMEPTGNRWTSRRALHVEEGSRNMAWLYGGRLKRLCEHANVPHLWCAERRTWKVSRKKLGELITYARRVEGRFVTTELLDQ
jgi:hypothetical protein